MADTRQIVRWCLEFQCPLRQGDSSKDPAKALEVVRRAKTFWESLKTGPKDSGVFGNIFVTGWTFAERADKFKKPLRCSYPSDGYLIAEEFGSYGGSEGLRSMCANCPANTNPEGVAGCAGTLLQQPESAETEDQLRRILSRLDLPRNLRDSLLATVPLWYGFWAKSPLPINALKALRKILEEMFVEDRGDVETNPQPNDVRPTNHIQELDTFLKAIDQAEANRLPLHVNLSPPGHTDFGFYTVFPHCPHCKSEARVKRWQRKYPAEPYTCQSCGSIYSPAATSSVTRMDWPGDKGLRELLGQVSFENFAKEYLVIRGMDEDEAMATVVAAEAAEQARLAKIELQRQRFRKQERYILTELGKDLTVRTPASENDFEDEPPPMFNEIDFSLLISRAVSKGIPITSMHHWSISGDFDKYTMKIEDPKVVLREWLQLGCRELFHATFKVPDSILDTFENPKGHESST